MQRKQVDYKSVLSLFLPQGILDYFDIVDYSDMGSYYLISLEERKVIPLEHSHMKLVSKGFSLKLSSRIFPPVTVLYISRFAAVVGRIH